MPITGASEKLPGVFRDNGGAVFNIKHPDFGGVLNGVADDTAPLLAALAAASAAGGGVVLVANGTGLKLTTTVDIPVRVTLHLAQGIGVTSNQPQAFRLNTYSGIVSDATGASITTTSIAAGAVISTATPAAQVGGVVLRNLQLAGQGPGNAGTIGLDMRGIANSSVENVSADSFETPLAIGLSGAITAYYNTYLNFRASDCKYGKQLVDGGANEQTFLGGKIGTCEKPIVATNVSGLTVVGTAYEGYTVNGPELTNVTGYAFTGVRIETAVVGLKPFRHLGTSSGALVGPSIDGNAVASLIEAANDDFVFLANHVRSGAIPAAMSGIAGDVIAKRLRLLQGIHSFGDDTSTVANADFIGRMYRSAASRSNYWAWFTGAAAKWYYGAGLVSNNEDIVAYSAALARACFTQRASDAALVVGQRLVTPIISPTEAVLVSGVDAATGNAVQVTLTAARLVGAPLNPTTGQRLSFTFVQDATGGWAVTWNATFKVSWSNTGNTAGKRSTISFLYDGTNWIQDAAQSPYL